MAGAAWATVLSQLLSGVLNSLWYFFRAGVMGRGGPRYSPSLECMGRLCAVGLPMGLEYSVSAIGAVDRFTVGVFLPEKREYVSNDFAGDYEIASLSGTVTTMDGEYYAHIHMCADNRRGMACGGHLNRARVSATCELVINVLDGEVNRRFDEAVGLNLLEL